MNERKTQEELLAKYEELRDRVWYQRHIRRTDSELIGLPLDILKGALDAAGQVEEKYANRTLHGKPMLERDTVNLRRLEGWMAAIMWATGGVAEDEDILYDT